VSNDLLRRELVIAGALLGAGFFALPFAIYWVGQRFVGEYAPDAGVWALAEQIWSDLLTLRPTAWLLVASPYLVAQLARLARGIWCAGRTVKPVTNSHDD
jgi:hypothetical protein